MIRLILPSLRSRAIKVWDDRIRQPASDMPNFEHQFACLEDKEVDQGRQTNGSLVDSATHRIQRNGLPGIRSIVASSKHQFQRK